MRVMRLVLIIFIKEKKINVGSCKHADLSVFSFHPLKTITTGEGGAITTNSKKLSDKLYLLRSLGIKKNKKTLGL